MGTFGHFQTPAKNSIDMIIIQGDIFSGFSTIFEWFSIVNEYLKDLIKDINNPTYFQKIVSPFNNFQVIPLSNETVIWKFLNSPTCKVNPYACQSKMKLEQY